VRIVPDELHIQDSEFYDTLYTRAGRVDKYDWMAGRFGCDTSVFTTGPDELHRIRRGALSPLFSRQRIVDLQDVIREKLIIFVDRVREFRMEGKILPINRAFMALTGEVVMEYCFSISYGHLKLPEFDKTLHESFMAASMSGHLSLQYPWVPKMLFALPEFILVKIEPLYALVFRMQAVRFSQTFLASSQIPWLTERQDFRKQIDAMRAGHMDEVLKSSKHPTVFQELISGNLPDSQKETLRLQDEAQLVVAAGVSTTGWALSTAAFHIINNPPIFQALRKELEGALPEPDAQMSWTDLERLPYLTGCVREAVRLSYAVTTRNPRLFPRPILYQDWTIPARTPVSMTMVDICDDEEIFPKPRTFDPERWQKLERYFVGFGKGTRACLGIK
jgi:cytochrome P450